MLSMHIPLSRPVSERINDDLRMTLRRHFYFINTLVVVFFISAAVVVVDLRSSVYLKVHKLLLLPL